MLCYERRASDQWTKSETDPPLQTSCARYAIHREDGNRGLVFTRGVIQLQLHSCSCHLILWCEPHTRLNWIWWPSVGPTHQSIWHQHRCRSPPTLVSTFPLLCIFIIKLMSSFANSLRLWPTAIMHYNVWHWICTYLISFRKQLDTSATIRAH